MKSNKINSSISWIISESKYATKYLILLLIIIIMITATDLTSAIGLSKLIDRAVGNIDTPFLGIIFFTIISVLANNVLYSVRSIFIIKTQEKIALKIREPLILHCQKIPLRKIDSYTTGYLYERIITDVDNVASFVPSSVMPIFGGLLSTIAALVYIISINWIFALFIIVLSPFFMILGKYFMPKIEKKFQKLRESQTELTSITTESLSNIAINKTLHAEEYITGIFSNTHQKKYLLK